MTTKILLMAKGTKVYYECGGEPYVGYIETDRMVKGKHVVTVLTTAGYRAFNVDELENVRAL